MNELSVNASVVELDYVAEFDVVYYFVDATSIDLLVFDLHLYTDAASFVEKFAVDAVN